MSSEWKNNQIMKKINKKFKQTKIIIVILLIQAMLSCNLVFAGECLSPRVGINSGYLTGSFKEYSKIFNTLVDYMRELKSGII